jgi:hypothetical protein
MCILQLLSTFIEQLELRLVNTLYATMVEARVRCVETRKRLNSNSLLNKIALCLGAGIGWTPVQLWIICLHFEFQVGPITVLLFPEKE